MQPFYEMKPDNVYSSMRTILEAEKHLHHHIELVVMTEGESHAFVGDKRVLLQAGQAFITFPNQVHHYLDDCGPLRGYLFIFSPNLIPAFSKTFSRKVPKEPIVSVDLPLLLPLLQTLMKESTSGEKYSQAVVEGCLSLILAHMFRRMEFEEVDRRNMEAIRSILNYCNEHYALDIMLEDIAVQTHMSKYHISHIFSKEIGMSFPQYINTLRIHHAKDILTNSDESITDIAYAVGFNSLRSFNRQFLSLTGKTPSEFKKSVREQTP